MPKPIITASDEELARMGITEVVQPWEDGFRTDKGQDFFEWLSSFFIPKKSWSSMGQ